MSKINFACGSCVHFRLRPASRMTGDCAKGLGQRLIAEVPWHCNRGERKRAAA